MHLDLTATGYTSGSHTTSNYGCVRGHTTTNGQDTFCCMHTLDVFRRGLQTNQDNSFTLLGCCLCLISGKVALTCCCTRRCRQCGTDYVSGLQSVFIESRMQ